MKYPLVCMPALAVLHPFLEVAQVLAIGTLKIVALDVVDRLKRAGGYRPFIDTVSLKKAQTP